MVQAIFFKKKVNSFLNIERMRFFSFAIPCGPSLSYHLLLHRCQGNDVGVKIC